MSKIRNCTDTTDKPFVYHMAWKISDLGVSALCFKKPHPIDLKQASWVLRPNAVTCKKCKAAIMAGKLKKAVAQ